MGVGFTPIFIVRSELVRAPAYLSSYTQCLLHFGNGNLTHKKKERISPDQP